MHDLQTLFVQTIASHFPEGSMTGDTVSLGFADLHIRCNVDKVLPWGPLQCASLFFEIGGGVLKGREVFASFMKSKNMSIATHEVVKCAYFGSE